MTRPRPRGVLGWHFLAEDRRLQFGTREVVEAGKTYMAEGPLKMCQNGVHASRRAVDALQYAPGPVVCRVRLSGEIQHDTDKSVARHRTVLWIADATAILHEFALVCGHEALGYRDAAHGDVDSRSWAVLDIKAKWLRGEATDDELARAAEAAWAAEAAEAAWAAGAARAAWAARAAEAAARDTQNIILELMLESLRWRRAAEERGRDEDLGEAARDSAGKPNTHG